MTEKVVVVVEASTYVDGRLVGKSSKVVIPGPGLFWPAILGVIIALSGIWYVAMVEQAFR